MQFRRFGSKYIVRMDKGEEIMSTLEKFCKDEKITLAEVKALGAVSEFEVGLFDINEKKYYKNHFKFPAEITSLWGTVTTKNGEVYLHIHMSAANVEGKVFGGHLTSAVISATCEMVIHDMSKGIESGVVERKFSDEIGLNLFEFLE